MSRLGSYSRGMSGGDRARIAGSLVLAACAAALGWLSLAWRDRLPSAFADHGISEYFPFALMLSLALLMIFAAWLLRGVVLARLQVAVFLSLIAHLLLLLFFQTLALPTMLARALEPAEIEGMQEILELPEYGGTENPQSETESWQIDRSVATPQRLVAEPRQSMQPDRPRERETEETLPETAMEPPTIQASRIENMAPAMTEPVPEQIVRQPLNEPTASERPAQLPELSEPRVAEIAPRDVAADVERQSAETSSLNQNSRREQLPRMAPSQRADEDARRAESDPSLPDRAQASSSRRVQSPSAAESTIDAATISTERSEAEFMPGESMNELRRSRAELAQGPAESASSAGLSDSRAAAARLSPSRSDRTPEVSGGSQSAAMARLGSSAGMQAAGGPVDAPRLAGDSTAAGRPNLEPGRTGVSRSATGGVAGPRGSSASSGPTSGLAGTGPTGAAGLERAPTRESVGMQTGSGAASGSPARANVGGGVTGAIGSGESISVSEAPRGAGTSGLGTASGSATVGRSSPGQIPVQGSGGGSSGIGSGLAPTRLGRGTGTSSGTAGKGTEGTEPGPRLGSNSAGGGRMSAGLPARSAPRSGGAQGVSGGIEQEAMGLTPGPQPGGGLTRGPEPGGRQSGSVSPGAAVGGGSESRASIGRRSASLPGVEGGSGQSPVGALAGTARPSVGAPGRRSEGESPELHPLVDKLARQVPPGALGKSGLAEMSPAFSLRRSEMRKEAARTLGGTPETERAVEMGIAWLAQHQAPDGSWGIHDFAKHCKGHECDGPGSFESPTAATGLALLAFLGAGYTHQSGQYQDVVTRGLKWLISQQSSNGDLFYGSAPFVRFYSHGIAAIALCEAYGMTRDAELREPTQKSLQFILDSQHPQLGGWRYESRTESDTSVSGWQLMALKSGEMAGFSIPPIAYQQVSRWLDSVERGASGGLYTYHPTRGESLAMSAEGLLMRQYLGSSRDNPRLRAGADYLDRNLPELSERDAYYWYYATQMMYHMQGVHWEHWNGRLRDMLSDMQSKEGGTHGSWSPNEPVPDRWGSAGGRLYITCMHLLMLEVYYRHLPLYQQLER